MTVNADLETKTHHQTPMTCTYGFSHFRHLQNCCNRDGNTIFKYMNYVPATDLEVAFFCSKEGGANTFDNIVYVQVILHTGQLFLWKCKMYIYYLLLHLFPSLCPHTVFDAAKFSIKLVYLTVSVVRQRNEYEIVTETQLIKTRVHNQLPSKMLICTKKIMIIAPSSDEIKYT